MQNSSVLLLVFLGLFNNLIFAEHLNYFDLQQLGERVVLSFELKSGAICNGIQIQRRIGNQNFQTIGIIDGVCGSPDVPEAYTFTDNEPILDELNVYRLVLNGIGVSEPVEILVVSYGESGYKFIPSSSLEGPKLYFRNDFSDVVRIVLFDAVGKEIRTFETSENVLSFGPDIPTNEIILFIISNAALNRVLRGKFYLS
jgi:hypothetical protein